jgi:hypothetical protein
LVFGAALAALAALAHSSPARAQAQVGSGDSAAALTLFEEGKKLATDGNYKEGCPKLLASYNLVQKLGTLLNLADCYEKSGKTASAWVRFTEGTMIAERAGQQERAEFARTHAAALVPRLSRLVITVAGPPPDGLEVRRDGALVEAAAFGTAVPLDPGTHTIEARAPHKKAWSTSVDIELDASKPRAFEIPALEADGEAPAKVEPPLSSTTPPPAGAESARGGTQRTWGIVLGGVGVASIGASLIGGLIANQKYDRSNQNGGCVNDRCTSQGLDERSTASTIAAVSTGLFIGGALLVGTGIVLYVTAPSTSASLSPSAGSTALSVGPGSVFLQRTW